jgi:very-short-patch-repair endonuclease/predicted transcriptional regulator of viral defense system
VGDPGSGYSNRDHPPSIGQAIAVIAARQYGVISSEQLRELGLDKFWVRRRVVAGLLHPLHRGVYAVGRPGLSLRGRYLAAVLACGPGAVLSHRAAAHLWGLRPNAAGRVEVTIGRNQSGPAGARTYRARALAPQDVAVRDGIPVTSVARTLLDLAGVLSPADLEVAIDRAERSNLLDLNAVVDVLERASGKKGASALKRVVAAYESSTQKSELERSFKRLLRPASDIPSPFFNALTDGETGTHEVDALWENHKLAVQLDGFAFHRTRRDREKDALSDADLELAGHRVMRLTWDDVTVNGERTLRRLRLALRLT